MTEHAPPEEELDPPGDPESVARTICLTSLAKRARSRAELATTLSRKGIPDDVARAVLDRFTEVGLIDDEALAATFAVAAHRERGLSGRAVATKLRQRGIEEPAVQLAVGQIDPDSERLAARALVERKLRSLAGVEPQARARRLVNMLARRGYAPGLAFQVVRETVADAELDSGPDD